jgi:hypothetical protein
MICAHIMGVPIEESALALAPAGAALVSGAAVIARSKAAHIGGWLSRRRAAHTGEPREGWGAGHDAHPTEPASRSARSTIRAT